MKYVRIFSKTFTKKEIEEAVGAALNLNNPADWSEGIITSGPAEAGVDDLLFHRSFKGCHQNSPPLQHLQENRAQMAEAFAKLYATQFGVDFEKMLKSGQLKAEATKEHDLAEDPSTESAEIDGHWSKANQLLIDFYSELKSVLS